MRSLLLFSWLFLAAYAIQAAPPNPMMTEVYNRLKSAIGDQQRAWPTLEIRAGASSVLAYNQRKNIIFVDEKALAVCQSFGANEKDAFAFLLAHEITHFYQEHHWQEAGFATSFLTDKTNFTKHVADEKEADLFGAFITHLAGYQSIKLVPDIFEKVYAAYNLTAELQDYPSLPERKKTALEVCAKVKELIQVFETANYLSALGEHTSAAAAYEYVLQFVKYKELYNNIGASLVAAAALQPEYGELAFHYPLELNLEIPLRDGADADKADLLQKAIEYLTIATQMDNQHYRTFINLACAYVLKKDFAQAESLLKQLYPLVKKDKQAAEMSILYGILAAQQQNPTQAKKMFDEAISLTKNKGIHQLANYNKQLLSGETITPTPPTGNSTETIDGIDLTYQNDFAFKEITVQDNFSYEERSLGFYQTEKATLVHLEASDKTIALLTTTQTKTARDLGVGTTYQQIKKAYTLEEAKVLSHSKGYYLVLPTFKLFFNMDAQNRVALWGTYEVY
ncbi:MAG: hypothetical protein AAGJ18_12040 [Bacteroidota bacterium]